MLKPGGAFFFSTFNQDSWEFDGRYHLSRQLRLSWNPLRLGVRFVRFLAGNAYGYARRLWSRRLERREAGHAILLHPAHDFGILVYATTLPEVRHQLADAGFAPRLELFGSHRGEPIGQELSRDDVYVHVIARKPGP